ncbi:N-acetylglucosamine kinase [Sphingobium amiense]|uniref:N-acetylglucosamine kinase n=1 Tax=Sphingobium amiense TaxID=135719 RepID=A0A494W7Y6_9SPHN|nr:BadF/BadG/BcrA/BcrD ATPase family protein [Sphingobium amiense]BBD96750.1 N-acetylglucosamine kinase [Sphingobium amiense]
MTPLYLGVDGGGTKTAFACIDGDGAEQIRFTAAGTYHPELGTDAVIERLRSGVERACAMLGISADAITAAFFGLPAFGEDAGADMALDAGCRSILGHDRYRCGNDMICGWAGSFACADGINVVAGTGSIAYGVRGDSAARAGGWGEIFSDEGSAFWIAARGLAAFARMSDGRAPKGPLHALLRDALALQHDLDLCSAVMGAQAPGRDGIAALAPLILEAAEAGDADCAAILTEAADHLADLAFAVRAAVGFAPGERAALSWSGSVLALAHPVRQRFVARLEEASLFDIVEPQHDPAYGAALYARDRVRTGQRV